MLTCLSVLALCMFALVLVLLMVVKLVICLRLSQHSLLQHALYSWTSYSFWLLALDRSASQFLARFGLMAAQQDRVELVMDSPVLVSDESEDPSVDGDEGQSQEDVMELFSPPRITTLAQNMFQMRASIAMGLSMGRDFLSPEGRA